MRGRYIVGLLTTKGQSALLVDQLSDGDAARSALAEAQALETKESCIRAYVEGLVEG